MHGVDRIWRVQGARWCVNYRLNARWRGVCRRRIYGCSNDCVIDVTCIVSRERGESSARESGW